MINKDYKKIKFQIKKYNYKIKENNNINKIK